MKVIIIGAGLAGLECAYILAKHGVQVTVLESGAQIGGCLQTFVRRASDGSTAQFDTGFHYVGGLAPGQSLHPLFKYFDLIDLPWRQLDEECFDEVSFVEADGSVRSFPFASGHENFVNRLAEYFPHQRDNLVKYTGFLKNVGDHIFDVLRHDNKSDGNPSGGMNDLFARSAHDFLCETISDPLLRKVLSATSLKMELRAESLPLYIFAQINNSFIQSAWRLEGGGKMIASRLADRIRSAGGEILTSSPVTAIHEEDGHVKGVSTASGKTFEADYVISSTHPAVTLGMVGETKSLRKIYRKRIAGLCNTFGMFTANISLKPGVLQYQGHNFFVHKADADLWNPDSSQTESLLVHLYPPEDGSPNLSRMDIISPMSYEELREWKDLPVMRRGTEYEALKSRKLKECLNLVSARIPKIEEAIDKVWTSSPLTYESYTGIPQGSAYGLRKDFNNPLATVLSPRTPIEGLLFTGQSLNLHGILGVSMTSLFTCAEILGLDEVVKDIL